MKNDNFDFIFLFNHGKEYLSYLPKAYWKICRTTELDKNGNEFTRFYRSAADILRFIEFRIVGQLRRHKILTPTVEQLEQKIRISNAELYSNLGYDQKTSGKAIKKLEQLGFIKADLCVKKTSKSGEKKVYDSKRFVSLRCQNIADAIQRYIESENESRKERSVLECKDISELEIDYGYYGLYLEASEQAVEKDKVVVKSPTTTMDDIFDELDRRDREANIWIDENDPSISF